MGKIGLKIMRMKRDKHTYIHTFIQRTSRLYDPIGPVGRFDENVLSSILPTNGSEIQWLKHKLQLKGNKGNLRHKELFFLQFYADQIIKHFLRICVGKGSFISYCWVLGILHIKGQENWGLTDKVIVYYVLYVHCT